MDIKKVVKEKGFTLTQVANHLGKTKGAFFLDETTPLSVKEPDIKCPHCGKPLSITLAKK